VSNQTQKRGDAAPTGSTRDSGPLERPTNESRLAQWSRRKAEARADTSIQEPAIGVEARSLTTGNHGTNNEEQKIFTDDDMPALDTLDEHSDYSGFFSTGVSEKLRKKALRKLFHLDAFNITDGLDDYAEDYTSFAPLGAIITADMRLHRQRVEQALQSEAKVDLETGTPGVAEEPIEPDPATDTVKQTNLDTGDIDATDHDQT